MADESKPLLGGYGTGPRVVSTNGEGDDAATTVGNAQLYKQRWRSIRIMYLTMFLSSIAFSICMASIYPFLQRLDPTTSTSTVGWVVASYCLGKMIASPLLGFWANRRHRCGEPLIFSMLVFCAANLLYAYLQDFSVDNRLQMLIVARTVIGFGAGNVAVARSYVAGATTMAERTGAMANIAGVQALGFVVGPAFQAAFSPLGFPGPVQEPWLEFNIYTAPALMSAVFSVISIWLVFCLFRELRIDPYDGSMIQNLGVNRSEPDADNSGDRPEVISSSSVTSGVVPDSGVQREIKPDKLTAAACIVLFFIILFMFSVYETISTPLALHMFDWTNEQSTLYVGLIMLGSSLISVGDFMLVKHLSKRFDERRLLIGSLLVCVSGYFCFLPWGDVYPDIRPVAILSPNSSLPVLPSNVTTVEPVGCPADYSWCYDTPKVYLAQVITGVAVISVGYPMSNVLAYSIYSKALGPQPQGTMMGWLTASGSTARMLGPVFVTNVYESHGPRLTFSLVGGIVLCGAIIASALYRRLVPYHVYVESVQSRLRRLCVCVDSSRDPTVSPATPTGRMRGRCSSDVQG